jgi:DNA-binding NarL/FixJ family response regulator
MDNSQGMPLLTPREEDVVRLVADGLKNREIAQKLKVKEHSIRNYIYRIFEKLGVSTRVELILYVFSHREGGGYSEPGPKLVAMPRLDSSR